MRVRPTFIFIAALATARAPADDLQHELLVFGNADLIRTSGVDVDAAEVSDEIIAADVLFTLQRGPFRLLGEYLGSNRESELERLQVGWQASVHTVVWLGRMHQPSSAWNHEYHHGQYLQTSITRPAIETWEDDGGVLPQHFAGLLAETQWDLPDRAGLQLHVGGGLAPALTADGLEPLDLLESGEYSHQFSAQARITYLPDALGESQVGILLAHNELNGQGAHSPVAGELDHVDQTLVGAFGRLVSDNWAILGVAYYVRSQLLHADAPDDQDHFLAAYVQGERDIGHELEAFGRIETSADASQSAYIRYFPNFVLSRTTVGLRWNFSRNHALTFEASDSNTVLDDFREFRMQWSAVLP